MECLVDDGCLFATVFIPVHLGQVVSPDGNLPGFGEVKAGKEGEKGGLAAAGLSGDGVHLPGVKFTGNILDSVNGLVFRAVRKR